jgi:hypothetical protein
VVFAMHQQNSSTYRAGVSDIESSRFLFRANFTDGSGGLLVAIIPEPSTGALLLLGLAGLGGLRGRLPR